MPTDKPRYTITLDDDLLKVVDDYRFNNRCASRTQATIDLMKIGIGVIQGKDVSEALSTPAPEIDPAVIQALQKQPLLKELLEQIVSLPSGRRKEAITTIKHYTEVLSAELKKQEDK